MAKELCEFISIDQAKVAKVRKAIDNDGQGQRMAETFRALADPTRLRIVSALEIEELCVCDIAALASLTQSLVSHHLQNLRQMNIVKYRRSGKMAFYSLTDSHIRAMMAIARDHCRE